MPSNIHAWILFNSLTVPIPRDTTIQIGRSINSDLRLFEDVSVSRNHCCIISSKGKAEVADLNSRNGTKVNGHRISTPTELHHHDEVTVGDTSLRILLEVDEDNRGTKGTFTLGS